MIYQILIPLLTLLCVSAVGAAVLAMRTGHARLLQERLGGGSQTVVAVQTPRGRVWSVLYRIGSSVASGKTSVSLREQLARAGYHGASAGAIFMGAKILLLMLGMAGFSMLLLPMSLSSFSKMTLILTGSVIPFFIPNFVVAANREKRRTQIRHHLPDAVDLLEVCVSSGMGLDMAWNLVAEEVRRVCPNLADELALTNLEIQLGAPRLEAMRHLSVRTGVTEIGSLVTVLVQSERFGTNVADALRTFASSMREGRSMRAEEGAERMAVRLLFPMVLFIFPAVFVVLVGPAWMALFKFLFSK